MSAQHTPGPWAIDWNISRLDIFSADAATMVCSLRRSALSDHLDSTAKANARLIAAAPEMLAALQAVLAEIDGPDRPHSTDSWLPSHLAHQVRVAVANATRPGSWSNA